jgi:carbon monoxide dehydrogenase subunit G
MGLDFTHRIHIACPPEQAFAYVSEFENNPAWQGGMVSCEWTSDTRGEVGSTYVQQARFMGKRIDTHFTVTALDPGRSIRIESTVSTFPIQVTRSVEPDGDGCLVSARIEGQPTGLMSLFSGMVKRSVAKDYRALKALLETQAGRP